MGRYLQIMARKELLKSLIALSQAELPFDW